MKITKFIHSCLFIEEKDTRLLFDPGDYSNVQNSLENLDAILITHEHEDHYDIDSLKEIISKNPQAKIFTNPSVSENLKQVGIESSVLRNEESIEIKGVKVEAFGEMHEEIYRTTPRIKNVQFLIAERFLHPGDSFEIPSKKVEILALPVVAPWSKMSETLDFAFEINPKACFPIRDGMLTERNPFHGWVERTLPQKGINVRMLKNGESFEV